MALFRKLFFRKPPDGLLEISERVYGTFQSFLAFIYLFIFLKLLSGVHFFQLGMVMGVHFLQVLVWH